MSRNAMLTTIHFGRVLVALGLYLSLVECNNGSFGISSISQKLLDVLLFPFIGLWNLISSILGVFLDIFLFIWDTYTTFVVIVLAVFGICMLLECASYVMGPTGFKEKPARPHAKEDDILTILKHVWKHSFLLKMMKALKKEKKKRRKGKQIQGEDFPLAPERTSIKTSTLGTRPISIEISPPVSGRTSTQISSSEADPIPVNTTTNPLITQPILTDATSSKTEGSGLETGTSRVSKVEGSIYANEASNNSIEIESP